GRRGSGGHEGFLRVGRRVGAAIEARRLSSERANCHSQRANCDSERSEKSGTAARPFVSLRVTASAIPGSENHSLRCQTREGRETAAAQGKSGLGGASDLDRLRLARPWPSPRPAHLQAASRSLCFRPSWL